MIEIIREAPINADELRRDMEDAAAPSRGYYLMLALAACLATFGLIADSTAVIIGAMIVAPLMNPIMATSYAIARGSGDLGKTAAFPKSRYQRKSSRTWTLLPWVAGRE
jgi:uncharacterized membrane protein